MSDAAHEVVWDRVRAGLATWASLRTVNIWSTHPDRNVPIGVSLADSNGRKDGATPFAREYIQGQTITLTAPPSQGCNPFRFWVVNGIPRFVGLRQISLTINGSLTAVANYRLMQSGSVGQLGAGCAGSGGRVPTQSVEHGNGSCGPMQGTPTTYVLENAVANTAGVLHIGFNTDFFGQIRLPWNLSGLGAKGCSLYHDLIVSPAIVVDAQGGSSLELTWPVDPAARGLDFHSTFAIVDFGANALGLVHSNALSVAQGGAL